MNRSSGSIRGVPWLVKTTLKDLTRKGLTVFMSTHLLRVVEELCDRLVIVKNGRIIYEEVMNTTPDEPRPAGRDLPGDHAVIR